jgi:hypothetical protein
LRHYAARSPVPIPDEVDFFTLPYLSSRSMALGSTQPLTEMSTRNLPGGKSGRHVGLTTLLPSMSRISENVGASISATLRASTACTGITLPYLYIYIYIELHGARYNLCTGIHEVKKQPFAGQTMQKHCSSQQEFWIWFLHIATLSKSVKGREFYKERKWS